MKKISVFFSLLVMMMLVMASVVFAAGTSTVQEVGPYRVEIQPPSGDPAANQAISMGIVLKNKSNGQPVTDAKVTPTFILMDESMPEMPMETNTKVQGEGKMDMEPGMYMIKVTPSQKGSWHEVIQISSSLGAATVTVPVKVGAGTGSSPTDTMNMPEKSSGQAAMPGMDADSHGDGKGSAEGVNWYVVGGFLLINLLVISTAGILKYTKNV